MQLYHIFSLASSNSNALTLVWIEPYFEKSIKLLRYGISLQLIESLLINLCRTTTMFSPFHSPPRPTMSGLCRYFPFQMSQKTCALYWTYLYLLAGSASCGEMKGTLRCPGGRLRRSLDVRGFRSLGSDLCGQCPEPFLGRVSVPFLLCPVLDKVPVLLIWWGSCGLPPKWGALGGWKFQGSPLSWPSCVEMLPCLVPLRLPRLLFLSRQS